MPGVQWLEGIEYKDGSYADERVKGVGKAGLGTRRSKPRLSMAFSRASMIKESISDWK